MKLLQSTEFSERILADCKKQREETFVAWKKAKNAYDETRKLTEAKTKPPPLNSTFEENGVFFQKLTCFPAWAPQFTPEREKPEDIYLRLRYSLIDNQVNCEADYLTGKG